MKPCADWGMPRVDLAAVLHVSTYHNIASQETTEWRLSVRSDFILPIPWFIFFFFSFFPRRLERRLGVCVCMRKRERKEDREKGRRKKIWEMENGEGKETKWQTTERKVMHEWNGVKVNTCVRKRDTLIKKHSFQNFMNVDVNVK